MSREVVVAIGFLGGGGVAWLLLSCEALLSTRKAMGQWINQYKYFFKYSSAQKQWPTALYILSGALKAGFTLNEALQVMIEESPEPLRQILKKKLGAPCEWIPFEKKVALLFDEPRHRFLLSALLLSHEVGGRQISLIEMAARHSSAKCQMDKKIRALTAHGRVTAWVVGGSPFAMMGLLYLFSPEMVTPFFHTALGRWLLGVIVLSVSMGLLVVNRMARLDI